MSLDDANPHANLDAMSDEDLDALEYGVVKMDLSGNVTGYNKAESDAAGFTKDRVLGRNFLEEVAPCTNNFMVAERFRSEDELSDEIDYVFTLRMRPTPVKLQMLKSASSSSMYLIVRWP